MYNTMRLHGIAAYARCMLSMLIVCALTCMLAVRVVYCARVGAPVTSSISASPKHPIVLIPGLAGSVLEAKLNRTKSVSWFCPHRADWRVIFLSLRELVSPLCLCDELVVHYNTSTGRYTNQPGVWIRPHDFGGVTGVQALNPSYPSLTATYLPLVQALEKVGYEAHKNLWGAPYDWRLAADGLEAEGAGDDLRALIETAYASSGHAKVVLVAHSMGNLVLQYFMDKWGSAWALKHVKAVLAVSGPWAGAPQALKGPLSGENFGLHFPHNLLHAAQGTAPSGPWLFPFPAYWGAHEVLVSTKRANYTAHNLLDLLKEFVVGCGDATCSRTVGYILQGMRAARANVTLTLVLICPPVNVKGTLEFPTNLAHPTLLPLTTARLTTLANVYPKLLRLHEGRWTNGTFPVPVTCLHGNGVDTDQRYVYDVEKLRAATAPEPLSIKTQEGDGTVPLRSLQVCEDLGTPGMTETIEVMGASHLGILSSKQLLAALSRAAGIPGALDVLDEAAAAALEATGCRPMPFTRRVWQAILTKSLRPMSALHPSPHCMRGQ